MTYVFGGGIQKKSSRALMRSFMEGFQSCSMPTPRVPCRMSLKLSRVTTIDTIGELVKVVYTDTTTIQSKEVMTRKFLVTVPLGVLKKRSIGFKAELPEKTLPAISSLGMGLLNKVFMFWNDNNDIFWPQENRMVGRNCHK